MVVIVFEDIVFECKGEKCNWEGLFDRVAMQLNGEYVDILCPKCYQLLGEFELPITVTINPNACGVREKVEVKE